jgi:hypothetical protein
MKKAILIAGGALAAIAVVGAGIYVLSRSIGASLEALYGNDEYGLGADGDDEDDSGNEVPGQLRMDI